MYKREIKYIDEKIKVNVEMKEIIQSEAHWHECMEIIYVLEGSVEVIKVDHTYKLETGDMYIMNSQDIHEIRKIDEHNNIILLANVNSRNFKKVHGEMYEHMFECRYIKSFASEEYLDKKKGAVEEIKELLLKIFVVNKFIYDEKNKKDSYNMDYKRMYRFIETNSCYIKRLEKKLYKEFEILNNKLERERYNDITTQRYYQFMRFMCANYNKKVMLDDVAKELNLSRYYTSRFIKENTGNNFIEFLKIIRVENCKRMMLVTDKSFSEIAEINGFGSSTSFIKVFKEFYNVTPTEYRKKYKVNTEEISDCFKKKDSLTIVKNNMKDFKSFYESINYGESLDIVINPTEQYNIKSYMPKIKYNILSDNINEINMLSKDNSIFKLEIKNYSIRDIDDIDERYIIKSLCNSYRNTVNNILESKEIVEHLIIKGSNKKRNILFDNNGIETNYYYMMYFISSLYHEVLECNENYILTTNSKNNYRILCYVDKVYKENSIFNINIDISNYKGKVKFFSAMLKENKNISIPNEKLNSRDSQIYRVKTMPKINLDSIYSSKLSFKAADKSIIYIEIAIKDDK